MGPGWVRWTVTWWEIANRSELSASNVVFPGNLQMNPGLVKWTVYWSEIYRMELYLVIWTEFCT